MAVSHKELIRWAAKKEVIDDVKRIVWYDTPQGLHEWILRIEGLEKHHLEGEPYNARSILPNLR